MSDKLENSIKELMKNRQGGRKDISSIPPPPDDAGTRALGEALDSSFKIVKLIIVGLVIAFIYSLTFSVQPDEIAVKLRFGKPVGVGEEQILKPGLHWALPYPIEEVVRISVGQSRTVLSTGGWYPIDPEDEKLGKLPHALNYLRPLADGYVISADGNVMHARATMKYRLNPNMALNYEFDFTDPTNLLQNILNNSIFYAAAHHTAEDAIYKDQIAFNESVRQRVALLIQEYKVGVTVESIDVQTSPPLSVRDSYDQVLSAQQEARTAVNQAESYARTTINVAQGQASTILADGVTRSNQIVRVMASEAKSFSEQLPYYEKNPELFKERLMAETMQTILTNSDDTFYIPPRDGVERELRIQLNREQMKSQREKDKAKSAAEGASTQTSTRRR